MLRIGLTGGVACGKSTVGEMLVKRGAHLLQADSLAHQLYAPGTIVYREIVRRFGREILAADGSINRAKLANLAFPDRISELNAIVHPAVIQAQNQWMMEVERRDPQGIAVVEAALIIEAGAAKHFDRIIVVTCGAEDKIARYAARSGMSPESARAEVARRSAAQLTDAGKIRRADYVIDNSGSREQTEQQVEKIWNELKNL
ncbi:MAG TPA: dephospho-CoA kinase [Terriglobales bacterium]|nr:dephospho-CoA kinase [Terriglobales bacterium]